jgi:flavorubredoxin
MVEEIKKDIYSVGASDPTRKLFDALIPLPDGTSYNAYVIKGSEKTVLIDSVDPSKSDILLNKIKELSDIGVTKIDYVIANHAEQDHSGTIPLVLEKFPDAIVLCSEKCKPFLKDLLNIADEKIRVVADKEKLSLGNKTLEFVYTPWVHWPETMVTYLHEDKILFSCDFFGSHFAADNLLGLAEQNYENELKRYFAEIMMPFRIPIKSNLVKLESYVVDLNMIAPSHGPVHINPKQIIDLYKTWISDDVKNLVIIPYVSMHGSTKDMADYLEKSLISKGIAVHKYDLANCDLGNIAIDLVDAATIVVGTPCLLAGIHPTVASALYLVNALRPKTKFVSIIASYGWAGKIADEVLGLTKNLKVEIITPVIIKGIPKENDLLLLDKLADEIVVKHKSLSLI